MEDELSSLTGAYEVEYCGLRWQKEIFSINCLVLDDVTKDEVLKQIFQTFNTSQTLHNLGIHEDKMELIGEMFCNESTTSTSNGTFYWPMTKIGTDVTIPCHANVATRHCSSGEMVHLEMPTNQYGTSPKCSPFTGVWQEPDMSQCYNTEGITQQLKNITIVDIGKENVEEVSTKLSDISKKAVYFKAEDIDLAVDIQEKMLPLISNVSADITLTNILLSINNMIDTPEEILVEAEQSDGTGSRMLDIIEAIPEEIPLEGQQLTALYSNLGIGAIKVEKDTLNGAVYGISFGNNGTEAMTTIQNSNSHLQVKDTANFISLGRSLLTHLKEGEESKWSRMTFFSLRDDKLYRVIQKSRTKAITNIYSTVIAASIPNIRITNLDEPVIISYNLINQLTYDETHPICKRIVIKHFIKLKKIQRIFTSYQTLAVEYRLSFSFLQNLRKLMTSKILVCLCISLAVSNLIFLVGMQEYATTKPAACKAVAALIHYFLMTSLMWMTVEVLHVCLAAVVVSQTVQRSFMIRSSILSWDAGYQRDRSILLLWPPWGSFSSSTFLSSLLMSGT
ncbi:adhesion G-protein coupled receptor G6-like [Octopus vulgaris]|uniref:Adhesion G-protein coupled receptor G6-like n=1 Tax=Octopus vulgaris TaxID=6645 RepID=A0AA36FLJ9_OCTVU|nr:adhesion G-protein coupled receptor G6-like [Octopus vulgaris]